MSRSRHLTPSSEKSPAIGLSEPTNPSHSSSYRAKHLRGIVAKVKFENSSAIPNSFKHTVLYKWDHDGHLDFPTKREKKAKKQKTTRGTKYAKGTLLSTQKPQESNAPSSTE
ncbi:hypothetical protein Tco_1131570 [Tanacetum coccineum]